MTTDLRLVPGACVAWLAAWWVVGGSCTTAVLGGVVTTMAAGACLVIAGQRGRAGRDRDAAADEPSAELAANDAGGALVRSVGFAVAVGALVLVAAGVQLHVRDASGLAQAAQAGRVVDIDAVVRDDPIPVVSPWGGAPAVLVLVDARSVTIAGSTRRAAAPLLIRGDAGWTAQVGARVRVVGRLAPADPGEREVAVLTPTRAVVTSSRPTGPVAVADHLRGGLLAVTDDLSSQARALVPGVAIGDVSRLDPDLAAAMRTAGLTHVTAVSGGHFAIVAALVLALAGLARLRRRVRAAVLAPLMLAFVVLVRPDPSVVRSAVMCAVAVLALCLGRPARSVSALAAGVIVLLLDDPWLARSFGFVLSAAATAGIVLGARPLAERLRGWLPWLPAPVASAVAVSGAAQAACGPVLVLLAPTVPLYAVPANVVAEPALVPATLLGVAATLVAPWWAAGAHGLAWCAGLATWWLAAVATVVARLPGANVAWMPGPLGAVALALLTVVGAVGVLRPSRLRGQDVAG